MDLHLAIEPNDILVVHLRDGDKDTSVSVHPSRAGVASLLRAIGQAVTEGYGDCFWPGATGGQYWWIFTCENETMEVCAMWTRGGASLWEHVFRSTDAVAWVRDRVQAEVERLKIISS